MHLFIKSRFQEDWLKPVWECQYGLFYPQSRVPRHPQAPA